MLLLTKVLPNVAAAGPVGPMRQQIKDRHGQVAIGVQSRGRSDDAVPVGICVIAEGDPIAILEADEPGHRVRARAVHPDRPVMVDGHEREGRIDQWIDDSDVSS